MRFFNRVFLATPESVELEFTLAGIGNRTLALLIDYHVMGLLLFGFWILWGTFSLGLLSYLSGTSQNYTGVPIWLTAIAVIVSFVIFTGYFAFFEVIWQGQTPGKRLTKIRVIRDDGKPIGLSQAALRALLRPIDDLMFLGAFFILFGKREKRLGDWAAGTLVIQEQRPSVKEAIVISDQAKDLATQLPAMAELSQLLPDDFVVIRTYLERRATLAPDARKELSLKLARQLRTLINLETIPPNTVSDHFLEAVYLAYQHQDSRPEEFS
ncbi:RDD family protein [Kovacikia minuta CCNUW1]|uniref:RDD family protein n=1 Tax=Kovacikia minuta TaxID=2931930 RepID=UPI001CCC536B|nr:RDD family protein [Kovacikia minuta]UBF24427.1 RDD family protein [Kovacikia minuta CCNUW1]